MKTGTRLARRQERPVPFDPVYRRDVRMIERRQRLGFSCEPGEALRVVRERLRKEFDRHVTVEPGVAGAVDLAHAARAEEREDLVRTDWGAGCKRHRVR